MRRIGGRGIGLVLVGLSMLALLVGSVSGYQSRRYVQCQARVNDRLIVALQVRAQASDQRDQVFLALLDSLLNEPDQDKRRQAVADYVAAQRKLEQDRREHPLPAPPKETCQAP